MMNLQKILREAPYYSPLWSLWKWQVINVVISLAIFTVALMIFTYFLPDKTPAEITSFTAVVVTAAAFAAGAVTATWISAAALEITELIVTAAVTATVFATLAATVFPAATLLVMMAAVLAALMANKYAVKNGLKRKGVYLSIIVQFAINLSGFYAAYQIV